MNLKLVLTYKEQPNYTAEAQYYLEMNEFDLQKALEEFDADYKF